MTRSMAHHLMKSRRLQNRSTDPVAPNTPPHDSRSTGRASSGRLLPAALAGLFGRNFSALNPRSGGGASSSLFMGTGRALTGIAILAALAFGLLFLLPVGPLQAQDDGTIQYAENGMGPVATYTATDPEGTAIAYWSLTGTDADAFTIEGGVLRFAETPDYEMPSDVQGTGDSTAAPGDNEYEITVQAMDSTGKTAEKEVMVEVTNEEEDGTVTLSARRPQVGVVFTASLADPDGDATNAQWQWAKSRSKNGSYTDIDSAEAATHTPTDASGKSDAGYYLRVTVSYTDPEGSGKSAMMKSEHTVQATRDSNAAPEFAADQDPVMEGEQANAAREVAENTEAGTDIGAPVVAEDDDNDTLTYTLTDADGGTDGHSASFAIDWATGQIMTKAALDFEGIPTYEVVVRATDPAGVPQADSSVSANSDEVTVVITVTDVNEAPAVAGDAPGTFNEDADIATELATYTATDPDADAPTPTWSVAGPDGGKFTAVDGELKFKAKPDYENPTDANTNNVYEVTVQASDGKLTGMREVKVTVGNEDEDGTVTLSKTQPRVGIAVTASLTDPDGSISSLTWQWSNDVGPIEDANSATYTPVTGDVGDTLTAMASYTDGEASGKTAEQGSTNTVAEDTRNKAPAFADEDSETDGVQNDMATRKVDENTKAVAADDALVDDNEDVTDNVGGVVMATDPDPNDETPTYTLGGDDAAKFRVRANGQIEVGSGTELDYETKQTYMVTLTAQDSFGETASIDVTIMVTDMDEAPDVSGEETPEYAENGMDPVATYTATDPEGTAIASWSLTGTDADAFTIEGGVLRFAKSPDYEMPSDVQGTGDSTAAPGDNEYEITVQAMDSTGKTAEKEVMVEVTNEEEDGTVTLSARRPQVGVAFTASLADPDGDATNAQWQWAKSRSKNGSYTDIDSAEAATHTPTDASGKSDAGYYLRVTVSYTDPEGSGKSAMMKSEHTVQATRDSNAAPEFAADQDPVMEGEQANAAREVAENTEAGTDIGAPVVAEDDDNDTLTYTLTDADGGTDGHSASFAIDWATGQIMTKAALDFEGIPTYEVVVRATDPAGVPQADSSVSANSDEVTVVITVTDVNEAPAVAGDAPGTFNEDADIATELATYTATDPDADAPTPTWSVAGPDGGKFTAVDGELKFKAKPDYENPTDANTNNVYEVTVQASDGKLTGMREVKVTVGNEDEDGTVTLSKTQPRVGIAVTASLTDPDGSISSLTWQWSNDVGPIEDANSATYTPVTGDVGDTLTAMASYTDGEASGKTAEQGSTNTVAEDTRNKAPAFADEDSETDGVQNDMATRKVDENTKAVAADDALVDDNEDVTDNVGGVVMATDPDPNDETPTYTLGGDDAAKFRVRANGQIEVGSGTELDYETKQTYMVTLTAQDSFGETASIDVTIMVTDMDEAPEIMVGGLAISGMSRVEYAEDRVDVVGTYMATGPDADMATWTLEGDDAGFFDIHIHRGVLTFNSPHNYEDPMDADMNNMYMVTIMADDGTYMDTHDVMVMVTNKEEPGEATLWDGTDPLTTPPQDGDTITGAVMDPDGGVMGETWQWARTMTPDMTDSWMDITGATNAAYMVTAGDEGYHLRVMATYTDAVGTDTAMEYSPATMMVSAVDEMMGEVTLWAGTDPLTMAPQVGETITGLVVDPDGGVTGETWQWSRTMDTADMNSWMDIQGATDAAYMVTAGDEGYHLRVMATYTDAVGTDTAMEYSPATMMVSAGTELERLIAAYDQDNNGIGKAELFDAIDDYLFGPWESEGYTKDGLFDLIDEYLFG